MSERGRIANLRAKASKWENADFTAGHRSYRRHLENVRELLTALEFLISRDGGESARWLGEHSGRRRPPSCPRLSWLEAFTQSVRYRFKSKLVTELVEEAAKDAVLMAQVHAQYLLMESGGHELSDRYRKENL